MSQNHQVKEEVNYSSELHIIEASNRQKNFLVKDTCKEDKKGTWIFEDNIFNTKNILDHSLG